MSHCVVIITGNLGRDPEARTTQSGKSLCTMSVGVDSPGQDRTTHWHRVVCFDSQADACVKVLRKGDSVTVFGRLEYRQWDKDGTRHTMAEIKADRVEFGRTGRNTPSGTDRASTSRGTSSAGRTQPAQQPIGDDDVPF